MKKANLSWLFIINIFLLAAAVISLARPNLVKSATATHLVISEIQIAGAAAGDDFVELYNPTAAEVALGDFRLVKRTATASADTSVVAFNTDDIIPAHGFFLWCNTNISAALGCNRNTSATITNNNSVALREGAADSGTVIDAVGIGTVSNGLSEGTPITAPGAGSSAERKANLGSTAASMLAADANAGNGEDTDNNANDFVIRVASQPQNASASAETPTASSVLPSASASVNASPSFSPSVNPSPSVSSSPSASPISSPSSSPTSTPSASPSASTSASPSASPSASISPSPSLSPSASPSVSPSASPSASASVAPSQSPSASPSMSPSVSPSVSASPSHTPQPSSTPKPRKQFVCKFEVRTFNFGWFTITFPQFTCSWKTV